MQQRQVSPDMQGFFAPVYDPKESMQSSQREKQSTVDEEVSALMIALAYCTVLITNHEKPRRQGLRIEFEVQFEGRGKTYIG